MRRVAGGIPPRSTRFMQRYVDNVVALSTENADVRHRLLRVFNLLKNPQTLFHPRILVRVFGRVLKEWIRGLPVFSTTGTHQPDRAR